jgi:hypothetical protein
VAKISSNYGARREGSLPFSAADSFSYYQHHLGKHSGKQCSKHIYMLAETYELCTWLSSIVTFAEGLRK